MAEYQEYSYDEDRMEKHRQRAFELRSKIDQVNISSEPPVVSEIVPGVIEILVNRDRVAVPVPIDYIWPIFGCDLKVVAVEPESLTVAALYVEYMTRSEAEPKLTVGEWAVDVGNVLMLDPLFPLYVRPGSRNRASVRGSAALFRPSALRLASASLRRAGSRRFTAALGPGLRRAACRRLQLASASLRRSGLWRSTAGVGPGLRCAARRATLRKVLPASLLALASTTCSLFRLIASLLRMQALTHVRKQTHR